MLHRLVVIVLGLGVAVPGLRQGAAGVGGIQRVQQLALFHQVALLEGIAEDLPVHQGADGVGVRGFQRAAGSQGPCDVPGLHRGLLIADGGRRLLPAQVPQGQKADARRQNQRKQQPFSFSAEPLFLRRRLYFLLQFFHKLCRSFPDSSCTGSHCMPNSAQY